MNIRSNNSKDDKFVAGFLESTVCGKKPNYTLHTKETAKSMWLYHSRIRLIGSINSNQWTETKGNVTKERRGGGSVTTESEIGATGPQAKECRQPPEAGRDRIRLLLLRRAQTS